jgi:hypothetical protein
MFLANRKQPQLVDVVHPRHLLAPGLAQGLPKFYTGFADVVD